MVNSFLQETSHLISAHTSPAAGQDPLAGRVETPAFGTRIVRPYVPLRFDSSESAPAWDLSERRTYISLCCKYAIPQDGMALIITRKNRKTDLNRLTCFI